MDRGKRIGDILLEEGTITESQLAEALKIQKEKGGLLGEILLQMGVIDEEKLVDILSKKVGVPKVNLEEFEIQGGVLNFVPENVARRHVLIPISQEDGILNVAMADPFDIYALDELKFITRMQIKPYMATRTAISKAIDEYYGATESMEEIVEADQEEIGTVATAETKLNLEEMAQEAPIVKAVNLLLTNAEKDKASDIHIEPEEKDLVVRYRVDGILYKTQVLPKSMHLGIASRIKVLAGMDIAEKRLPQDGKIAVKMKNKNLDLRVSTFPTIYGENVVIRILDKSSVLFGIEELGLRGENLEKFKRLITQPYGIILVTGPTGSGKSTTLYAALSYVNSEEKNIITVEDPVEYNIEGIRQSQINVRAGFTFVNALRSILRQDPDVIMVGEIRDLETAIIAVQASLTGHLVFSTLHTNDAPSALTRLVNMGIDSYLASSSVIGIIAQRLVRLNCPKCRVKYTPPPSLLKKIGVTENITFHVGKGCRACKERGYMGRTGIFEMLLPNDKIKDLILENASASVIRGVAREYGMQTLREAGMELVKKGEVDIKELLRVTQDEEMEETLT